MQKRVDVASVLALLLATGWAANHVTALFPTYQESRGITTIELDIAFGVYALGLLPGLLGGGTVSDRIGRRRVVLPGAALAAIGTVVLSLDLGALDLAVGRFVVGLGAGLTFAAGTAWATDLAGRSGAVLAGVFLSTGFALGPLVSGTLATLLPAPLLVPFVLSLSLSLAALVGASRATRRQPAASWETSDGAAATSEATGSTGGARSVFTAASWALPVGALVFASVSVPLIALPPRLPDGLSGPLLVGVASVVALGGGSAIQQVARLRGWGPRTGVVGAGCAAIGMVVIAATADRLSLPVFLLTCALLGLAYGLCLREGLLDVEALCPVRWRGTLLGVFYVTTYLGFALPLLLTLLEPMLGVRTPLLMLAGAAAAVGTARAARLGSGHPGR